MARSDGTLETMADIAEQSDIETTLDNAVPTSPLNPAMLFALKRLDVHRRRLFAVLMRRWGLMLPFILLMNVVLIDQKAGLVAMALDVLLLLSFVHFISRPVQNMVNRYHRLLFNRQAEFIGLQYVDEADERLLSVHRASGLLPKSDRIGAMEVVKGEVDGRRFHSMSVVAQTHLRRLQNGSHWRTDFAGTVVSVSTPLPKDFRLRISPRVVELGMPAGLRERNQDAAPTPSATAGWHGMRLLRGEGRFGAHFQVMTNDELVARKVVGEVLRCNLVSLRNEIDGSVGLIIQNGAVSLAINHNQLSRKYRNALPWSAYCRPEAAEQDLAKIADHSQTILQLAGDLARQTDVASLKYGSADVGSLKRDQIV